jgi:hypothetical protein
VIRGDLLVIPIEQSLLYVQPLYLQAEGGRIPELKRVVVAYQNQVVMEETLEGGLARLFGGAASRAAVAAEAAGPSGGGPSPAARPGDSRAVELTRQAVQLYESALAAQRAGDWARYGAEVTRLGEVLRQLQATLGGRQP